MCGMAIDVDGIPPIIQFNPLPQLFYRPGLAKVTTDRNYATPKWILHLVTKATLPGDVGLLSLLVRRVSTKDETCCNGWEKC